MDQQKQGDFASDNVGLSRFVELLYNCIPKVKDIFEPNFLRIHMILEKAKEYLKIGTSKNQRKVWTTGFYSKKKIE